MIRTSIAPSLAVVVLALLCGVLNWGNCVGQQRAASRQQFTTIVADGINEGADDDENGDDVRAYVQRLETLVDQYRNLIAKSILRLSGACTVYDRLAATSERTWYAASEPPAGRGGRAAPVDIESYIVAVLRQLQSESPEQIVATFARQNATEPGVNVLFYVVTTSNLLRDAQLDRLLAAMLYDQCCTLGVSPEAGRCDQTMRKRQPAAETAAPGSVQPPQKKQRFHAWGGKRSRSPGAGGGAQVVIRAPFHAWGGRKRSVDEGQK